MTSRGWPQMGARSPTTPARTSSAESLPDEEVAREEIVEHARRLEQLTGRPVRAFSYPYGQRRDATPMVERILRESGHSASSWRSHGSI